MSRKNAMVDPSPDDTTGPSDSDIASPSTTTADMTIPFLDDMFSPLAVNSASAMSIPSPTAALADDLSKIGSDDDNESLYYLPTSDTTTDLESKTIENPQHLRGVPLA